MADRAEFLESIRHRTRTGRYKRFPIAGLVLMTAALGLLAARQLVAAELRPVDDGCRPAPGEDGRRLHDGDDRGPRGMTVVPGAVVSCHCDVGPGVDGYVDGSVIRQQGARTEVDAAEINQAVAEEPAHSESRKPRLTPSTRSPMRPGANAAKSR